MNHVLKYFWRDNNYTVVKILPNSCMKELKRSPDQNYIEVLF